MVGCGGGGSETGGSTGLSTSPSVIAIPTVAIPQLPGTGTAVALTSATDNPFTKGKSYSYSQITALITVVQSGNHIEIQVRGDEQWNGSLNLGADQSALKVGDYQGLLERQETSSPGSFSWKTASPISGCGGINSHVMVDRIVFDSGTLTELSFRFEQNCFSGEGPLKGAVRWLASDTALAPGPTQTIPTTLWTPAAGTTPATGNYIYLESAGGDPVGEGKTYLHTQADAVISAILAGPHIKFSVRGDATWVADFQVMDSLSKVQPGYYADLRNYTFRNPRKGGLEWSGIASCHSQSRGWIAVDKVQYQGDVMTQVDLRFEQRCLDGLAPPLRGKIHWSNDDQTLPTGPHQIPSGIWQARSQSIPSIGNFVYLEGESGDWISNGQTLLYTQTQSPIRVFVDQHDTLTVQVGESEWEGIIRGSYSQLQLQVGFYGSLQGVFRNPARGGVSWRGQGRGCDGNTGWVAVDDVAYTYGELRHIDFRFEHSCKNSEKRLNGRVRWTSSDPVVIENRIDPPLSKQIMPPLTIPVAGNYVQLVSGSDDYIGGGDTYLYTSSSAEIKVDANYGFVMIAVNGDERWSGQFGTQGKFEAIPGTGTYKLDQTQRLNKWSGEGRGCNNVKGSFTIDRLDRTANGVQALDMSFEQYCDGAYTPLRGRIHWVANDLTQPPGPVYPVSADLWRLPPSQMPTSGNYLFLHSAPGSFVGHEKNHLFTSAGQEFRVMATDNGVTVNIAINQWILEFRPMLPLTRLQPGYYGQLKRAGANMNPARGGLSISGDGRGCNSSIGWFVVDSVAYVGSTVSALDLRFMQLCEETGPPLYGQLRWRQ
jgi:hypothetical protein